MSLVLTMRQATLLSLALVIAVAKPEVAAAQDTPPEPTPPTAQTPPAAGEAATAEGAQPENPEATRRARELLRQGMGHYQEGRWREALQAFESVAQIAPSANLWFNIARAHEQLGEWSQAAEGFRRYLRDSVNPSDRAEVEALLASLDERAEAARAALRTAPSTGTLRVESTIRGATVGLDGRESGNAPIELSLAPGAHELAVSSEGRIPFRSAVRVQAGVTTIAFVDPAPSTRYRSVRGSPVWAWVVGGLSVVSLGTAIGFGVHASSINSPDRHEDARSAAGVSDAFLAGSIGLAAIAAILYFVESQAVGTEREAPPVAEPAPSPATPVAVTSARAIDSSL